MVKARHVNSQVHRLLVLSILLIVCPAVSAELVVIYDNGNTRPISDFLGPAQRAESTDERPSMTDALTSLTDAATLLPIESPGLTPGTVSTRAYHQPFAAAFFLIGADQQSLLWLQRHRAQLLDMDAVGLLVQAESIADLEAIAAIANGLSITPASGSDIAKALDISHYPVAVSGGRIWQ